MIKFAVAFVVCCSLSVLLVEAVVVCPPFDVISPCTCAEAQTANTTFVFCASNNLNDPQASDILDAYLKTPGVSPMGQILLSGNLLTHVPVQMKSFTQLEFAFFGLNSISSIESGAFNLADDANPLQYLDLHTNQLTTIAPGAFKGSNFIIIFLSFFKNCH